MQIYTIRYNISNYIDYKAATWITINRYIIQIKYTTNHHIHALNKDQLYTQRIYI